MRRTISTLLMLACSACGATHELTADLADAPDMAVSPAVALQQEIVAKLVTDTRDYGGATAGFDWDALTARATANLAAGDGSKQTFYRELRRTMNAIPLGHSLLMMGACGVRTSIPWETSTWYGVCGAPLGDAVVVTSAKASNRLGLSLGDVVTAVDRIGATPSFLRAVADEPSCGSAMASEAGLTSLGAFSLFAVVQPGDVMTVRAVDGSIRKVTVPEKDEDYELCTSPFGDEEYLVKTTVRDDGVWVFRIPTFSPLEYPLPPLGETDAWVNGYVAKLKVELDKAIAAHAKGIIWDARSNTGGAGRIPLAIVAGFPGAKSQHLLDCSVRDPASSPPTYSTLAVSWDLVAGGPLAYDGRVAVLVDGQTFSGGDYFAYATKIATKVKIFGSATSGAFTPQLTHETDDKRFAPFRYGVQTIACVDAAGVPIEGKSVQPDVVVDYDPNDLAIGKDTIVEAAAKYLATE